MRLNFKWVRKTSQHSNGENLYLNRIHVAGYNWNALTRDGKWAGNINLPSIKNRTLYDNDQDAIKARIEKIVANWFKEAHK